MLTRRAFLRGALALIVAPHSTPAGQDTAPPAPLPMQKGTPATEDTAGGRRSNALVFTVAA